MNAYHSNVNLREESTAQLWAWLEGISDSIEMIRNALGYSEARNQVRGLCQSHAHILHHLASRDDDTGRDCPHFDMGAA